MKELNTMDINELIAAIRAWQAANKVGEIEAVLGEGDELAFANMSKLADEVEQLEAQAKQDRNWIEILESDAKIADDEIVQLVAKMERLQAKDDAAWALMATILPGIDEGSRAFVIGQTRYVLSITGERRLPNNSFMDAMAEFIVAYKEEHE